MAYHCYHGVDTRIVRIFNIYGLRMRADDGRGEVNGGVFQKIEVVASMQETQMVNITYSIISASSFKTSSNVIALDSNTPSFLCKWNGKVGSSL